MAKSSVRVVGSTCNFSAMFEKGVRIDGHLLSCEESTEVVQKAITRLSPTMQEEVKRGFFKAYKKPEGIRLETAMELKKAVRKVMAERFPSESKSKRVK
jgi:hypothetical protein